MSVLNMRKDQSEYKWMKAGIAIALFLLFVLMISWTVEFAFLTLLDIRLILILIASSGILTLIGQRNLSDLNGLRDRIRFNLLLTGMVMSLMLFLNLFAQPSKGLGTRMLLVSTFKPLLLAAIIYLPILNLVERFRHEQSEKDRTDTPAMPDLTRREKEVFETALLDHTNKEIAEKLFIAEATVKKHMQSILKKSGCSNREELIAKYKR